tara:strand:+ start:1675 stop:1917 length:243 start_codon:yes stop_codon:yes gene_type:complete
MIGNYIHFPVFCISFLLGVVFVFLSSPKNKVVHVYPTPDNVNKIEYIDKAKNCYAFQSQKISCPDDSTTIKTIPIQTQVK